MIVPGKESALRMNYLGPTNGEGDFNVGWIEMVVPPVLNPNDCRKQLKLIRHNCGQICERCPVTVTS
jgi:hypothetical protein